MGIPDCYRFASLDLMSPFFPAVQSGSHTLQVPNQPSLVGLELFAQGAAGTSPSNAAGW